jgi:hypothetical protein
VYKPRLFVLSDREPSAPVEVLSEGEAKEHNQRKLGVFHVVNAFTGPRRIENLQAIHYWYADMDSGSKEEQLERIALCPLKPTVVVETAKGYHVYWRAKDATLTNWDRIVKRGIVPALEADPKASDPLRLLRRPGYFHWKGEPFEVQTLECKLSRVYTEAQMMDAFPEHGACRPTNAAPRDLGDGFWARVAALPGHLLTKLSGHPLCNGEEIRLVPTSGGKANVEVRAKGGRWRGTPVWVDAEGVLAGVKGGSSIGAWCHWYGRSWREIAEAMKEVYGEELSE